MSKVLLVQSTLLALLQNEPEDESPVKGRRKRGWECVRSSTQWDRAPGQSKGCGLKVYNCVC